MKDNNLYQYLVLLGDSSLILGQRLSEWCGHGPALEVDIALTNIALDLLGQTRNYFQYAAQVAGDNRTEDDIAMLREAREYKNVLLVEQKNGHFGHSIVRQFFFDSFHLLLLEKLTDSQDEQIAAIARKSIKEVKYHLRFSTEWVKRLGLGTAESHAKIVEAVNDLYPYTQELCTATSIEEEAATKGYGVNPASLRDSYFENINTLLTHIGVAIPQVPYFQEGGKSGMHSEQLGFILAELQWLQKTYPKATW